MQKHPIRMMIAVFVVLIAFTNTAEAKCNNGCSVSPYTLNGNQGFYCCVNSSLSTSTSCVATDSEPQPGPYSDDACTRNGTFNMTNENGLCGAGHTCKAFPTAGYTAAPPYNNILVSSISGTNVPSTLYCCSRTLNGGYAANISFFFQSATTGNLTWVNGELSALCVNSSGARSSSVWGPAVFKDNNCTIGYNGLQIPNASSRITAMSTAAAAVFAGLLVLTVSLLSI